MSKLFLASGCHDQTHNIEQVYLNIFLLSRVIQWNWREAKQVPDDTIAFENPSEAYFPMY